jgi:hypothetical protein
MLIPGLGRSQIRFDMFDLARSAEEARRAQKLGNLYHRGQELVWDGREVLQALLKQHGGIKIDPALREPLGVVFGVIMWGELAAWKISLQLADRLPELEPKMAATSQAHDEARHFYVMYDYLSELGYVPKTMDRASRAVLDLVLDTDELSYKLLGMQLMVESLALTIFQAVREARLEPVLADLLRYYEKDEARHVGLGVQYLPGMVKRMSQLQAFGLFLFQLKVIAATIAGLKSLEPSLRALGIDPRRILTLGRAKQTLAFNEMGRQMGLTGVPRSREVVIRAVNSVLEPLFPRDEAERARPFWKAMVAGWRADLDAEMPETSLDPTAAPGRVSVKIA